MTDAERIMLLEETLNLEEGALREDMLLEDVEEYDSMAKLSLIVMLDEEFKVKIDSKTIKGLKSVKDILALMK